MTLFLTIIAFFVIFSVLILVHELGHFFAAKRAGIKVLEFGFGMPPRLWGIKKGETIYSINWIPFGGFVRMYGEDDADPKVAKNPRSFTAKSLRSRIWVVAAGIVMNLVLAFLLLTGGFLVGMQPLIASSEDFLAAVADGTIIAEPGVRAQSVMEGSLAEASGVQPGDIITAINGTQVLSQDQLAVLQSGPLDAPLTLSIVRGTDLQTLTLTPSENAPKIGLSWYPLVDFPAIAVRAVPADSVFAAAGLRVGDLITYVDGVITDSFDAFSTALATQNTVTLTVFREGETLTIPVVFPLLPHVIIMEVRPDSRAAEAGIQLDDAVVSVGGQIVNNPEEFRRAMAQFAGMPVSVTLIRAGQEMTLQVTPNSDGLIGVVIGIIADYGAAELSVYPTQLPFSVTEIKSVRYGFFGAIGAAVTDIHQLSRLTFAMLGSVVSELVSTGDVPEGVAGPVGIAEMTYTYVQEGFMALVRFTALLSLSLAVMNVVPFPALDGGRLFFLVLEGIRGKKVHPRTEAIIHNLGFGLLLLLIVFVTYNDLVRIVMRVF